MKGIRKNGKLVFSVINKITLTLWVINDPCQNRNVWLENDNKKILSIKNVCNSKAKPNFCILSL